MRKINICVTYQLMGDNSSALKCFTKILNIDSHEIQAWNSIEVFFIFKNLNNNERLQTMRNNIKKNFTAKAVSSIVADIIDKLETDKIKIKK